MRIDEPAAGFAVLPVFAEARWVGVQAFLFGEARRPSRREQPRWEAWMREHFLTRDGS